MPPMQAHPTAFLRKFLLDFLFCKYGNQALERLDQLSGINVRENTADHCQHGQCSSDQHDQKNRAKIGTCMTANVDVGCANRMNQKKNPTDDRNRIQNTVSKITPRGNRLIRCGDNRSVILIHNITPPCKNAFVTCIC